MLNLIFYYTAFGCILLLLYKGEVEKKKLFIYYGYLALFLLSALRYDIGNDYSNYWYSAEELAEQFKYTSSLKDVYEYRDGRFEIGFCVLTSLFFWSENAFFWVSLLFSAIFVVGLYNIFSKYKCHYWGMFLVIIAEFVFLQWDWIRQSGAFAFILISLVYAHEKNIKKFIFFVILASLFHKSAIFILAVYPLLYVDITSRVQCAIIMLGLIMYWSGILDGFVNQVSTYFSLINGYDKYDSTNIALSLTHTSIFSRIRLSIFILLGLLIASILDKKYILYRNLLTIGLFIYMLGGNSLLITRIAWYFIIILFPCFGIYMNQCHQSKFKHRLLFSLFIIQIAIFSYDIATDTNTRGCVPYKSIFSEDFSSHTFDVRTYQ